MTNACAVLVFSPSTLQCRLTASCKCWSTPSAGSASPVLVSLPMSLSSVVHFTTNTTQCVFVFSLIEGVYKNYCNTIPRRERCQPSPANNFHKANLLVKHASQEMPWRECLFDLQCTARFALSIKLACRGHPFLCRTEPKRIAQCSHIALLLLPLPFWLQ